MRVRPYYLYQCDLVEGSGHFRTPISKGIEIMEGLRGHTSGYAVPTYMIDAPGGGGKIPVSPNYLLAQAPGRVVLRNFEGFVTTYQEPLDYDPEEIKSQEQLVDRRPEPGQEGITDLLEGKRMTIEPEGFVEIRSRGGKEHRLRSGDQHKWQPLGIGSIETDETEPESLPAPKKELDSGQGSADKEGID